MKMHLFRGIWGRGPVSSSSGSSLSRERKSIHTATEGGEQVPDDLEDRLDNVFDELGAADAVRDMALEQDPKVKWEIVRSHEMVRSYKLFFSLRPAENGWKPCTKLVFVYES